MAIFVKTLAVVGFGLVSKLFNRDEPKNTVRAAYEARGQIRSEVTPARYVVGTARVSGVLARHFDYIDDTAAETHGKNKGWIPRDDATDRRRRRPDNLSPGSWDALDRRMRLWSYWAFYLCSGVTDGIQSVYVNGVLMPIVEPPGTAEGDWEPAVPEDRSRVHKPFWSRQWLDPLPKSEARGAQWGQAPAITIWEARGRPEDATGACARKTEQVYGTVTRPRTDANPLGTAASPAELRDAQALRGDGLTWTLVRLVQDNGVGDEGSGYEPPGPWERNPQLDFVVKGKGPASPNGDGFLLDGNPARAAYWVLTEQMGVDPRLVHEVWEQSANICDDVVLTEPVGDNPTSTPLEVGRLVEDRDFLATLQRIADEEDYGNLDGNVEAQIDALNEWKRRRSIALIERYAGRPYAFVSEEERAVLYERWNEKFASATGPGARPRYRANGVIPTGANWAEVLESLAESMAGSIEEHGGTWYIRAGSAAIRPEAIITDDDVVENRIVQQLEPGLDEQPTTVRASLLQNERGDFGQYVLEPVTRDDATLGAIDADDAPPVRDWDVYTDATGTTYGYDMADLAQSEKDLGVLDFVTDPLQGAELMRIALYRSRWNTRTIQLTIGPGRRFKNYSLGKGAPVLLNSSFEGIAGEQVGERTDSMRCVIAERPRYVEGGNIELVLRQEDEEVFGEKYGLVFDYEDFGDVVILPPRPVVKPLECEIPSVSSRTGERVSIQATATGGVGAHRFSLRTDAAYLAIDSATGLITGTVPSNAVASPSLTVIVRDEANTQVTCTGRLSLQAGREPYIARLDLAGAPGVTVTGRLRVRYPSPLHAVWVGTPLSAWTFRKVNGASWITVGSDGSVTAAIPSSATTGDSHLYVVEAQAPGVPSLLATREVNILAATAGLEVTYHPVIVQQFSSLPLTDIVDTVTGAVGNVTYAMKTGETVPAGFDSPFPSAQGDISAGGQITAAPGDYTVQVIATDSRTPTAQTHEGTVNITVQTRDIVPTCTITPSNVTIFPSEAFSANVSSTGLRGTALPTLSKGPSWLEVTRSSAPSNLAPNLPYTFIVRKTEFAPVGTHPYTVSIADSAGTEISCSGTVVVERDRAPLSLVARDVTAHWGETYLGSMVATGGVKPYRYSFEGAGRGIRSEDPYGTVPQQIGLTVEASTGHYGGAVHRRSGAWSYTARVTDAEGRFASTSMTVTTRERPAPPETRYCGSDSPVTVNPGQAVDIRSFCRAESELHRVNTNTGDGLPSWVRIAVSGGRNGSTVRITGTVPSTATSGTTYSISVLLQEGSRIGETSQQTFRATLRVATGVKPVVVTPAQLQIRQPANVAFSRQLVATGGPAAGNFVFAKTTGPTWLNVSATGLMTFPARNAATRSQAYSITVTKGSTSETFHGTILIRAVAPPEIPTDERF